MNLIRNPRVTALTGIVVLTMLVLAVAHLGDLPLIGVHRDTYRADFVDAGGLKAGDPVEVAGTTVGRIDHISIDGHQVVVEFGLDHAVRLGSDTTAAVAASDLLGKKYLALTPKGTGGLADATIETKHTVPAYNVVDAFAGLTHTATAIDTQQLGDALDTLAMTFRDSPNDVKAALSGLSRFSRTIASRDTALHALVQHAEGTTEVFAQRRADLASLIKGTNSLLAELSSRQQVVHRLLVNTRALAAQLIGVVHDNQSALTPALHHLAGVTHMLSSRQAVLRQGLRSLRLYASNFLNVVGTGPWFDNYIPRVPDSAQVGVN